MRHLSPQPTRNHRRGRLGLGVAAVVLLLAATGAPAQEPEGLKLVGGVAYEPGGPGPALEAALMEAGYDDEPLGIGASTTEYPFYHDEGLNVTMALGVRYRFVAPLAVEALLSTGQRGHAEGLSNQRGRLTLSYGTLILATNVGLYLGPVRVAVGPAVNRIQWDVVQNSRDAGAGATMAPGVNATTAVDFRVRDDVLLTLKAGLRRFGEGDLRPAVDLPFRVDYSTYFVGITIAPWG